MQHSLALLPFLALAALGAVTVLARYEPGRMPRRVLLAGRLATLFTLLSAVGTGLAVLLQGPLVSPLLGVGGVGLSIRLDALSTIMFSLVSFIGAIVFQFSRNYLDGDSRHGAFLGGLTLTLAAVLLLVLSGNLFQLVAAWIGSSLALQKLLLFYPNRQAAVIAARKKFIPARISDVCVVLAAVILAHAFSTLDIGTIIERARDHGASLAAPLAAVLLAIAALLKSAQFPTHAWLPEVMETPTPVSALLHAGIINAGGFLVIRFADVMLLSPASLYILAIVGGFTALFGSVVMLTQASVKVSLAYSTVAQMGFMMLQCGLGAFSVAVLHIVAHSLYKAHAFLSSNSIVEIARTSWVPVSASAARPLRTVLSLAGALGIFLAVGWLFGVQIETKPAIVVLGGIFILGLTHLLAQSAEGKPNTYVIGRTVLAATGVAALYFALTGGAQKVLASTLPAAPQPDAMTVAIMLAVLVMFAVMSLLQLLAPMKSRSPGWRRAYVHFRNGFYVNAVFNRLVGAMSMRSHQIAEE
jgi:NAD(P)H-quinone oxidoreductase subunit 5